jgi:broad specificity phosphatase PhoE
MDLQGRAHGELDPPLSYTGQIKLSQIARAFKNKNVTKIHTSPRKRALETAKAISKATGAPIVIQPALIPWRLGNFSGAKVKSVRPVLDFFSARPGRSVPGGEPKISMLNRYKRFRKTVGDGEVIVGHSQHVLSDDYALCGGDPAKVPMFGDVKNGMVKEIR